jgi:hypothetical protein
MLSIDLFNSKYERKLREGAVDDLEARRIDDLNMKMLDLLDRAKESLYKNNPEAMAGLKREYQKFKDERDSYYKIREQQVPSKQDPFAYVKPEPKGIGDIQDPKQKMAQLAQKSKKGPLANVGAGLKAFIKGEPEPMDEEQELGRRGIGMANMKALQATVEKGLARTIFQFPAGKYVVGEDDTDKMADYYNGLDSAGRSNFVYNVLGDGAKFVQMCRELGIQAAPVEPQQPELPGMPTPNPQGQLPLQEKKKSNSDDLATGDIKVARELQKLRAEYPAARSDVEAVARAEIDSTERSQRQLAAIRGANEKQDALLKQLVTLDQKQGREIDALDKENDSLEKQLDQVQRTNAALTQTVSQMTGTKKSARPATQPTTAQSTDNVINLIPGAPADQQTAQPTAEPAATKDANKPEVKPTPELPKNVVPIRQVSKFTPPEQLIKAPKVSGSDIREHGGGIGPRQHWQDLMQEGQPQELINRYLAIDAETDVEAVRKAIQAISRDPALGANSKSRLLGQIGMIIRRHRLPIGRSYYQFMQQYMEAVELDRNRVVGYPQDPATVKHRLDTAKAILGNPRSDADSRREAAAIVAKLEKKVVAEGLIYSGDTWQDVLYRINVLNDIFGDQKDLAASFEPASQPEWGPFRDRILRSRTVLDTYAKVKQLANMNVPLTDVEIEMLADVAWDGGGGPVEPAGHWGERDYDWLEDLYAQQFAVVQHLLDQKAQGHGQNKTKSGQTVHEQGMAETVTNVKAGMAEIYRRLAPKIERHRDSFLAGQLYDELENYAELHGAEGEFKQMMNGARNRAHMEYDTNPGGFHNWFWFLPFEDDQLEEGLGDTLKSLWREIKTYVVDFVANAVGLPDDQRREVFVKAGNTFSNEVIKLLANHPARDKLIPMVREIGGYMAKARTLKELNSLMDKAELFLADVDAGKFDPPVAKTLPSFGDRQGMTENTDDVKKRMSKLEALALAANRAGDDAKCKMYQQKIQSLKQKLSQSMNEFDASGYDRYSIYMDDYDLEEKFSDLDDAVEAIEAYKRDDPKSRYADYNVRDLNGKVVWRNDAWQDIQKPGKIQFLPRNDQGVAEARDGQTSTNNTGSHKDSPMTQQQWMQSMKQQYPGVKFAQNKTTMQIFAMAPGKGKVGTFDPRQQVNELEAADLVSPNTQTNTPPRRAYSIALQGRPGRDFMAEHAWEALNSVFPREYPAGTEAAEQKSCRSC